MFSNRTVGVAADVLESETRTKIDAFICKHEVPTDIFEGKSLPSKRALLECVFHGLQQRGHDDIIREMLEDLLRGSLSWERREELEKSLSRDGFAVEDGYHIATSEVDTEEEQTALEVTVRRHQDLAVQTLLHHLHQNRELFAEGNWDASIGQARNFVEQLLEDIAHIVSAKHSESLSLNRPVEVRNYLERAGFFSDQERRRLIDGIYGFLSEEGSHPGISDHSAARVCRLVLLGIGQYLIEKLDSWQSGSM